MRNKEDIEKRIEIWKSMVGQFFPLPENTENLNRIISMLNASLENYPNVNEDVIKEKKQNIFVEKESEYFEEIPLKLELKWVLGEHEEGALKGIIWMILTSELHDAECTMKNENSDIILEGKGGPPDFNNRGRSFSFWLRLKKATFEDMRESLLPIEKIWILYPEPSKGKFQFTAQDDTLSGLLRFSAEDYEVRVWDHTPGKIIKKKKFLDSIRKKK